MSAPASRFPVLVAAALAAAGLLAGGGPVSARQAAVAIDGDDVGGVVRGPNGPEAGVWVIAETDDFATRFVKIVVTDDEGRYVLPDLPDAGYKIRVRGYGLADSPPAAARPGETLDLTAVPAATPREAAAVYPANYWYALMEVPDPSEFPGTGPDGNGIAPGMRTQAHWIDTLKQGCQLCHQLGNLATREIPNPEAFDSTAAAWAHRIVTGQRAPQMASYMNRFGRDRGIAAYADWTDRITAGEVPEAPPRPRGRERDVVLTMWAWGGDTAYVHDEIATDKRDPRVNAGGPVYGVEFAHDKLLWVDPAANEAREVALPVRDTPGEGDYRSYIAREMPNPSFYFGDELLWNNPGNPHNPMMDGRGRIWMTHQIRGPGNPAWCREGSGNPFARHYPLAGAARHAAYYDPATGHVELIDTCFNTHHLQPVQGYSPRGIDIDRNGVVWTALSGSGHLARFDRGRCAVRNGPAATGQHCPEGWTLHATPGPQMQGVTAHGSADFHYYNWVDQFDTLGLGPNVPIATGSTSDALLAFLPDTEEFVVLRVPYPLGFYSRGMDGRIDDPDAGWKGRAVWADYGTNAVWHIEGGKGTRSHLVKFQVRPHPLAH